MNHFASPQAAKEFLAEKIVLQAQIEGVPLTEVERKMLYFSETDWTLPDAMEVNAAFEREYDQDEYENKIAALACDASRELKRSGNEVAWSDAVRLLKEGDHYLLVML